MALSSAAAMAAGAATGVAKRMGGGEAGRGVGLGGAIVWDAAGRRFHTPDGVAYLEYQEELRGNSKIIDLVHTYVPPSKRGGGVASHLCQAACAHAREHNLRIIASCTYVAETFLPRNPEWKDLVLLDKRENSV